MRTIAAAAPGDHSRSPVPLEGVSRRRAQSPSKVVRIAATSDRWRSITAKSRVVAYSPSKLSVITADSCPSTVSVFW